MDQRSGLAYMQQRYYDPQIGRFLSVDPMASDTKTGWNFNRYSYAADNPYRFTDPDGRVIEVKGNRQQKAKINEAIAELESKPSGAALVKQLKDSPLVFTVQGSKETRVRTDPTNESAARDGIPTGAKIVFNPDQRKGGKDSAGSTVRSPFVDLAHEFGHARALATGTQGFDAGTGEAGTTPEREEPAMKAENDVRSEHGLPLRPSYIPSN